MITNVKTIPAGYKQTEIGMIPEDWDVKNLGETAYVTKLAGYEYTNHFNSYKDGGEIIVIRGTNITHDKLDLSDVRRIPRSTSNKLPRSKLSKDDLVFAYVGTIGPVFLIDENDKYHLGPNTCKIIAENNLVPQYLFLYFKSSLIEKEIKEQTSVGAQPSLSMTKIRSFRVILPKEPFEQTAIATVISDTDALIEKLEKLIAKKKAVKQGAMQQLLTGKKRLPWFSEEWEVRKLGEIAEVVMGQSPLSEHYNKKNIGLPLIQGNADIRDRKTIIRNFTSFITKKGKNGDIIMSVRAPVGEISIAIFDCCLGRGVCAIRFPNKFLYHHLIFIENEWGKFSTGSTFDSVNSAQVKELGISLPNSELEQTAIATVLSDMDTEIEGMEKSMAKYQQIKTGMMQQLLTGKIRLVKN